MKNETLKNLIISTKAVYEEIDYIYSKALKNNIYFTGDGFHHLRYDGARVERSKKVQYTKLGYFNSAVNIITTSTTIQEYSRKLMPLGKADKGGMRKTKMVEYFAFYSITSFSKKERLKVVIRRIGEEDGKFHFWSVIPHWALRGSERIIASKEIEDD